MVRARTTKGREDAGMTEDRQHIDPATIVGRTITAAEVVDVPFSKVLQLALDDGRTVHIEGYTDVFSGDGEIEVFAPEDRDPPAAPS